MHVREGDGERVLPGVRRLPPQVQVCLRRLEERKEGNTEKTVIKYRAWPDSAFRMPRTITKIGNMLLPFSVMILDEELTEFPSS